MARRTVTLTYGTDTREFEIDEEFLAGEPIAPRKIELPERDPHEVIHEALANPLGSPRLRELVGGKRVCLVVSDDFRAGLQVEIGECLREEMAASEPRPSFVSILPATGTHNPEVYAKRIATALGERAQQLGLEYELVMHDCDTSPSVEVATTSYGTPLIVDRAYLQAEVRVYGHEAKHHYMAGYSCIDKQVIPGVSMRKTVEANHKLSLDDDSRAGNISWHKDPARQRNPFSGDAREGREILEGWRCDAEGNLFEAETVSFGLDMISSGKDILWVAAGAIPEVNSRMPEQADKFGAFQVERQKYVLISPGGPPASQALYGTQNCFDMALLGAILEGGEALVISPCDGRDDLPPDVSGLAPGRKSKELFYDNLVCLQCKPLDECETIIRNDFELYLWKTIRVLRLTKKYGLTLYLYSELPDEKLTQAGFVPCHDPQAWLDERAARGDGKIHVIDGGNKLFVSGTTTSPGEGKDLPYCTETDEE